MTIADELIKVTGRLLLKVTLEDGDSVPNLGEVIQFKGNSYVVVGTEQMMLMVDPPKISPSLALVLKEARRD